MSRTGSDRTAGGGQTGARDARLKAALRANLARRKAQSRARQADGAEPLSAMAEALEPGRDNDNAAGPRPGSDDPSPAAGADGTREG